MTTNTEGSQAVAAPPREEVLAAIRRDAKCQKRSAEAALTWLEREVAPELKEAGDDYHPYENEMAGIGYRIVDRVMPHGQHSQEGSAHRLIERFLGFEDGSLMHDQLKDATQGTYCDFWLERVDPET